MEGRAEKSDRAESVDPTIAETPRGRGAPGAGEARIATRTALHPPAPPIATMTPDEAVNLDEARRALVFVMFIYPLCAITSVATFVVGGDPTYRAIHIAGMGVAVAAATWLDRKSTRLNSSHL